MLKFGQKVTEHRKAILAVALFLLIPSVMGYFATRVNYNILTYLPQEIDTVKGEDILIDEFGKGGFTMVMTEGMPAKDVANLTDEIKKVKGVSSVIGIDSLTDGTIPTEMLPDSVSEIFNKKEDGKNTQLMAVFFDK